MREKSRRLGAVALAYALVATVGLGARDIKAYVYDELGYVAPCPQPYIPKYTVDLSYLPSGNLDGPRDFFLDRDGNFLIVDTGNARLLRVTNRGEVLQQITHELMRSPEGAFIDPATQDILVADSETRQILRFDEGGALLRSYPPPTSDVLPQSFLFAPSKVLLDARGWLYVIGTGTATGIVLLDEEGSFRGFFGANRAPEDLLRRLVRMVATEEQKIKLLLQSLLPSSNFFVDEAGFIYTVTREIEQNQIRRLNLIGVNTFPPGKYGEPIPVTKYVDRAPQLASVDVDEKGVVTVLDDKSGKIFQYSLEGDLLFIFGGIGDIQGTFWMPADIAIDNQRDLLYVLDAKEGVIQVFEPSRFARLVYEANQLYYEGNYEEALSLWVEVLALDANYPLAHKGLAKALAKMGIRYGKAEYYDYAMAQYRLAGDRPGFSEAFGSARELYMRDHAGIVMIALLGGILAVVATGRLLFPFLRKRVIKPESDAHTAISIMTHPFRSLEVVRYGFTSKSVWAAWAVLVLAFAARVMTLYLTSFQFASWDAKQVSLIRELSRTAVPWLTWCFSNWLVTLILSGEGTFGKIFVFSAYAFVPYIVMSVILTGLSHVFSLTESGAYASLQVVMYAWVGFLLVLGVQRVHNYTLRGALGIAALSVVGIVLLWGVAVLLYGLVGGFLDFIRDIVREATYYV